ncbi:MAG TPA: A/G-specific adenine glycosylase [Xanthobacteraceae bacterium]|nr:A/G-specific adenine glycosylase [Xanthobacteraceae bacterium]
MSPANSPAATVAVKPAGRQSARRLAAISFPQPTALLAWYDRHRRALPWRAAPGKRADPYRVWLSEIMLQQTTVKAAAPYYARFLARWCDVRTLAAAPLEEVLKAWAGLGYYARARNLHACARAVVERHGGEFPANEAALRALPGIGAYTAAAIAAIAFDAPASPVDGNIERVIARLFAVAEPLPGAKPELRRLARELTPQQRAGDFAQAMMDLGATICTPKKPACALCPWNESCAARKRGDAETFPRRIPKREGVLRRGAAFVARRADGFVLVRTRPAKGLLGGMTEMPTTQWAANFAESSALAAAPRFPSPLPSGERSTSERSEASRVRGNRSRKLKRSAPPHPDPLPTGEREICWRRIPGVVRHVFTHFPLELFVYLAELPAATPPPAGMRWVALSGLSSEALPSVMRKIVAHALGDDDRMAS